MSVVRPSITSPSAARISCSLVGSTDDVASSRIRIRGSASTARAMAMRWRCPPDSENPCSPMTVSYPSGSASMNSSAPASRAARSTCSSGASGSANAMFSRTESEKRNVSSKTMPTALAQLVDPQVADVDAVEQDPARLDVVEARDQPRHGGLAAAGRADDRDRLAAADREVEPVEHRRARARSRTARPRSAARPGPAGSGTRVRARRRSRGR